MPNVSTTTAFVHLSAAHEADREACFFCDEVQALWEPEPRTVAMLRLARTMLSKAEEPGALADRADCIAIARTSLRIVMRSLIAWQTDVAFTEGGDLCSPAALAIAEFFEQFAAEVARADALERQHAPLAKTRGPAQARADRKVA